MHNDELKAESTVVDPKRFKPGRYQHYKGGEYLALFLTTHHETNEIFVAYVPYNHPESGIRLREYATPGKDSWTDLVEKPRPEHNPDDGPVLIPVRFVERFRFVG